MAMRATQEGNMYAVYDGNQRVATVPASQLSQWGVNPSSVGATPTIATPSTTIPMSGGYVAQPSQVVSPTTTETSTQSPSSTQQSSSELASLQAQLKEKQDQLAALQTQPTQQGVPYDQSWSKYGVDQNTWNSMNATQQGVVAASLGVAKSMYSANASNVTLSDALAAAASDPSIISKYSDALKLDTQALQQSLQQTQQATSTTQQLQQAQFENERKQLAEQSAAAGQAYSGFRNKAQEQMGQQESAVVQSSRATLQQQLQQATTNFEQKYGSAATTPASVSFLNPYSSAGVSLSGLQQQATPSTENLAGTLAGGITGTQPTAQKADVLSTASQYVNLGQIPNVK